MYLRRLEERKREKVKLFQACDDGDIVSVKAALAGGLSANTRGGGDDQTCLIVAVQMGHEEVFKLLLQQEDCDLTLENRHNKWTALHYACMLGKVMMVKALASHPRQDSLNSKDCKGRTAVMTAVWCGEAKCVMALGRVDGVDLDTRDGEGRSLEEMAR